MPRRSSRSLSRFKFNCASLLDLNFTWPSLVFRGSRPINQVAMAWGKSKDENALPEEVPHLRKEERPASLSEPLPKQKLNKDLQKILDQEDSWFDQIYEGGYVVSLSASLHLRLGGTLDVTLHCIAFHDI